MQGVYFWVNHKLLWTITAPLTYKRNLKKKFRETVCQHTCSYSDTKAMFYPISFYTMPSVFHPWVFFGLLILESLNTHITEYPDTHITGWVMKHFQYSVMGHGILLRSLGWATKIAGEISFPPPAHPSSYCTLWPVWPLPELNCLQHFPRIKNNNYFYLLPVLYFDQVVSWSFEVLTAV